jgi:midasin
VSSVNASSNAQRSLDAPKRSRTEGQWSSSISSLLSAWDRLLAVDTISTTEIEAPCQRAFDDISKLAESAASCYSETIQVLCHTQREQLTVVDHLQLKERLKLLAQQLSCVVVALTENTSALNRFGIVISRLFTILFHKGFCKPEEEEEGEGEGEGEGTQDGTGMDDGQGEKDVTNEIQNEDQLMNMKDLEEQKEQPERNEDDEDNAADVETDFQAGKEEREQEDDGDDENDDNESDAELGEVDEQQAMERKKSKKDRDDGEMDEDQGDEPDTEIPEDDLAPEGDNEEDETGGFANKEEQIKDANGSDEEEDKGKDKELIGDNDKFSDDGSNRSDGEDDDGSSTTTEGRDDDASETGSQPDESKPEEGDNEENEGEENKPGQEQQATEEGGDEGDDISEHSDASYEEDVDENNFEGGQQDNREGEEKAQESERDRDKKAPQDSAGADDEAQGEEEKEDDAGRSWKRQEDNKDSKRKDNSNQNKSSSNPFSAIKEALKRHQRQLKQLDLSKNVKLKDDPSSKNEPNVDDARPPEADEDIDDFEFSEEGQQMGLAATETVQEPNEEQQEPDQQDPADENGDDNEDEAEDGSMRRKKRPQEIDEGDDDEGKDSEDKKKKKRSSSSKSKVTRTDVNEDDEEDIPEIDETTSTVDDKLSRGRQLWLEHEASVQGMAQQLCEQLRLILAPTVADKLQGDYKTGKRINIKKIIPYIASQYKKDRIWLRRTKPNKRTYQIVVALDDSLSMQMNNAGSMSLQTVALLSKAMQQLDVGEFGLISFGKKTNIVHPLAESFSIESGPRAFSEITFEQTATNMRGFLETSLDYLDQEGNRMGGQIRSNTQQLQQIMFVISDGQITEDRKELRKHLARAEERRQFVVLIILDIKAAQPEDSTAAAETTDVAPKGKQSVAERMRLLKADREQRLKRGNQNKGSILDMQLVEFEGTKVVKKPYLDDFPFPYYLVVKDLQTLPQVVADAMRQWFEMINATH